MMFLTNAHSDSNMDTGQVLNIITDFYNIQ